MYASGLLNYVKSLKRVRHGGYDKFKKINVSVCRGHEYIQSTYTLYIQIIPQGKTTAI